MAAQHNKGHALTASPDAACTGAPEAESAEPDQISEQLERILASSEFVGSERTRKFLRYVVEETLAGRSDRIKAFSVAVAAFGRDESFDPQNDPIVRIEAARLRRSLERYYLVAGGSDLVRIDIPRGTYVPTFSLPDLAPVDAPQDNNVPPHVDTSSDHVSEGPPRRSLARFREWILAAVAVLALSALLFTQTQVNDGPEGTENRPVLPHPSVAVLAFKIGEGDQQATRLAGGITNEIVRELLRYESVFVLGPRALQRFGAAPDVTVVGAEAGADFVLTGDMLLSGERFLASVSLSDTRTGGIVWAETYDRTFTIDRLFDVEVEIARDIVRRIGQPQGAIAQFDWKRTRGMAPEAWEAYDCVVQADELHRRIAPPEEMGDVLDCLKTVTDEEPGYADAWTMLALIELDVFRFGPLVHLSPGNPERALAAASRAVDLAPDSARAQLAMMSALNFYGNVEAALAAGQVAIRLSPHDPDLLAEVGLRNIVSGDLRAGMQYVEEAIRYSPTVPTSYRLTRSLGLLRSGAYQGASEAVTGLPPSGNFVHWAIVAAVQGKAGRLASAREAANELLKLYPDFPDWAWLELERRNMAAELADAMVDGWRAAGMDIPASPPRGEIN